MQRFKNIASGISISLCISFLIAILILRSLLQQLDASEWVEHTYQMLDLLDELALNLQKAETSESSYLLTRNEYFFNTFQSAVADTSVSLHKFETLIGDNAKQQKQLQNLKPLIFQHLDFLKDQVEAIYFTPFLQRQRSELKIQSLSTTSTITTLIAVMKKDEFVLLEERSRQVKDNISRTLLFNGLSFVSSFMIIFLGLYLLFKEFIRRQEAEQNLQDLNNLLEAKVQQRTAALLERETYLKESEEKFRQLAENVPDMFWIRDIASGKLLYLNPSSEKISGRDAQFFHKDPNAFLESIHPEDRENVPRWPPSPPFDCIYTGEYRIIQPDGSLRWIAWKSFPIRNTEGVIYRRAGTARDITQEKEAEALRIELVKEKELSQLKLEFYAMASHEFRTPLNVILLSAQILEQSVKEFDSKYQRNIFRILTATRSMTLLLQKVLIYLRASRENLEFVLVETDFLALCEQIIEEVRSSSSTPHLNTKVIGEKRPVLLDKDLVKHIFRNLLTNAIKYTPLEKSIDIKIECTKQMLILAIKDQGIGIPQKDLPRIFEPFQRGSNVSQIPGTGLGLATVKACVSRHGGQLFVITEEGKYSLFTVHLPIQGTDVSSSSASAGKSLP